MEDKKQLMLQAMQNMKDKRIDQREKDYFSQKSGPDMSQNLASGQLDQDVLKAKGGSGDVTPESMKVSGGTDKINTRGEVQDIRKGEDFAKEMKNRSLKGDLRATMADAVKRGDKEMIGKLQTIASKLGKRGLKALPIVGGIASAIESEDVSAAIPVLDSAESVGMSPIQEDMMLAETQSKINYMQSPAAKDRLKALAALKKQ